MNSDEIQPLRSLGLMKFFSNLVQAEIIEPISGHGKGKYKFKKYGSIWEDDKDQSKTNAGNALRMAMAIVDIVEGYDNYADAMDAFTKVQPAYVKAREYCRPLAEK